MTPYEVYIDYLALKRHFTSDYDYKKFKGKVKVKRETFEKRKDRYLFEKIARHYDPHGLMLANISKKNSLWIRDLTGEDAKQEYLEWTKREQARTRFVELDLDKLDEDFNSNFIIKNGTHPHLLKLLLGEAITIETFIILTDIINCFPYWDKHLCDDFIWNDIKKKCLKLKSFITYDKDKIKKCILEKFS